MVGVEPELWAGGWGWGGSGGSFDPSLSTILLPCPFLLVNTSCHAYHQPRKRCRESERKRGAQKRRLERLARWRAEGGTECQEQFRAERRESRHHWNTIKLKEDLNQCGFCGVVFTDVFAWKYS